jgi:hypothetical protein
MPKNFSNNQQSTKTSQTHQTNLVIKKFRPRLYHNQNVFETLQTIRTLLRRANIHLGPGIVLHTSSAGLFLTPFDLTGELLQKVLHDPDQYYPQISVVKNNLILRRFRSKTTSNSGPIPNPTPTTTTNKTKKINTAKTTFYLLQESEPQLPPHIRQRLRRIFPDYRLFPSSNSR